MSWPKFNVNETGGTELQDQDSIIYYHRQQNKNTDCSNVNKGDYDTGETAYMSVAELCPC